RPGRECQLEHCSGGAHARSGPSAAHLRATAGDGPFSFPRAQGKAPDRAGRPFAGDGRGDRGSSLPEVRPAGTGVALGASLEDRGPVRGGLETRKPAGSPRAPRDPVGPFRAGKASGELTFLERRCYARCRRGKEGSMMQSRSFTRRGMPVVFVTLLLATGAL